MEKFEVHILGCGSALPTTRHNPSSQVIDLRDKLFMIERTGKLGLGTAYITGFKWSVENKYDYIFEMDADFSHNPQDLPRLYKA